MNNQHHSKSRQISRFFDTDIVTMIYRETENIKKEASQEGFKILEFNYLKK